MLKLHRFRATVYGFLLSQGAVWTILSTASVARAQTQPSVLVLNITEDAQPQDDLRTYVSRVVTKTGAHLVDPPMLPPGARDCADAICMSALAAQHRAELILTARIERTKGGHSDRTRVIKMWLYDARTEGKLEQQFCRSDLLEHCLGSMAQQLVGVPLGTAPEFPPPSAHLAPPAGKDNPPSATGLYLRPWRIGLAVGLGALAVSSLGASIGLQQLEGQPASRGTCPFGTVTLCAYDLTPAFITGYVAAASLAIGATLALTVPGAGRVRR